MSLVHQSLLPHKINWLLEKSSLYYSLCSSLINHWLFHNEYAFDCCYDSMGMEWDMVVSWLVGGLLVAYFVTVRAKDQGSTTYTLSLVIDIKRWYLIFCCWLLCEMAPPSPPSKAVEAASSVTASQGLLGWWQ